MNNMSDDSAANSILNVLAVAERLKTELRHSWLSNGRRESVAEHTWLMCLMALLCHGRLGEPVRLDRLLAMIIVHDLAEAEVGDIPYFETGHRKDTKAARERAAFDRIAQMLPGPDGAMIRDLWDEFEHGHSPEARFARALDHLEVQVQHNLANLATWEPIEYDLVYTKMDDRCAHDAFLRTLCGAIRSHAEAKMRTASIDVDAIRRRLDVGSTRPG